MNEGGKPGKERQWGCDGESVMLMGGEYGDKNERKRREKIFCAPKKDADEYALSVEEG